jgi:chloramphenicol-sensitive protein RarD
MPAPAADPIETRKGLAFALAAFGFWGLVPIYFKAVRHVDPLDVLAHRVVWSIPLIALLISRLGNWTGVREALRSPKTLGTLLVSAILVATNWFVFIYGVGTGRILQTSLGYYFNPLVNVLLGLVVLRESLSRLQTAAVLLAAAGTAVLGLRGGEFPWIALVLAFSFGTYGLIRKTVRIDSMGGLFIETVLLSPAAMLFLAVNVGSGNEAFISGGPVTTVLLVAAGAVTAIPLIWFASAARRLPYSILGMCQYLAPSMSFILAVLVYGERFTANHAVAFGCIWTALAVFAADSVLRQRRIR